MSNGVYVGIDLGTTYSSVAYIDSFHVPRTVRNIEGMFLTPSVVLFEDLNKVVVGTYAKSDRTTAPKRVVECVKPHMGRRSFDFVLEGRRMPPETISALILKKLKQDAERRLGPIAGAVITVPAYFDDVQRTATYNAGEIAGLPVTDIINEPTAAALAHANRADADVKTALAYDLGGATFDVTAVSFGKEEIRVLATRGAAMLGGRNWDDELMGHIAGEFRERCSLDPRKDPDSRQELMDKVVTAKEQLSFRSSAVVRVHCGGRSLDIPIERETFERLTEHLLGQTQTITESMLADAWLGHAPLCWDRIDKILLVGGSTRIPMVRRMLESISGRRLDDSLEPDEVVGWGAAIHAAVLKGDKRYRPKRSGFVDVNAHALGVAAYHPRTGKWTNIVLIPANTPLPAHKSRKFKLRSADGRKVAVEVLEGEDNDATAADRIAKCYIRDLPPGLPAGTLVKVTYGYRADGRIDVTATIPGAGKQASLEIDRTGELSEDQIAQEKDYVAQVEVS